MCFNWYLDNCPTMKIARRLGLGFGLSLGLVLGCGRSFSSGAIALEPFKLFTT